MPFERFTAINSRGFKPRVSIWKGGHISLNQGAARHFKVTSASHAVLFYDKSNTKIGIKITNDSNEEGAISMTIRGEGKSGATIAARTFLEFYGIDYSETRKYTPEYDEDNQLWTIQLQI